MPKSPTGRQGTSRKSGLVIADSLTKHVAMWRIAEALLRQHGRRGHT